MKLYIAELEKVIDKRRESIILIQKMIRGYQCRRRVQEVTIKHDVKKRIEEEIERRKKREEELLVEKYDKATKIQACIRRYLAIRLFKQMKIVYIYI